MEKLDMRAFHAQIIGDKSQNTRNVVVSPQLDNVYTFFESVPASSSVSNHTQLKAHSQISNATKLNYIV